MLAWLFFALFAFQVDAAAQQGAPAHIGGNSAQITANGAVAPRVAHAGWFIRWAALHVTDAAVQHTGGTDSIKIGEIVELKYIQTMKLIQILFVAVKKVGGAEFRKKTWQILTLGLGRFKDAEDDRNFHLADYTLKSLWQCGFVIEYYRTIRNAAIYAANKVAEVVADSVRDMVHAAVTQLGAPAGNALNRVRGIFGFDPWDGSVAKRYPPCPGGEAEEYCLCFQSTTGVMCDDGKGQTYLCAPEVIAVCSAGEVCVPKTGGLPEEKECTAPPTPDPETAEIQEAEQSENEKLDAIKTILWNFVDYFLGREDYALEINGGTLPDLTAQVTFLGRNLWQNLCILAGVHCSKPAPDTRTIGQKLHIVQQPDGSGRSLSQKMHLVPQPDGSGRTLSQKLHLSPQPGAQPAHIRQANALAVSAANNSNKNFEALIIFSGGIFFIFLGLMNAMKDRNGENNLDVNFLENGDVWA